MPNPYVNKVTANGQTLIDLTTDTAVASDVAAGKYFHLATGERVAGTASGGGGATYRLDNVVPEQTVACTTFVQNNSYYGFLTFSSAIEDSEQYLVTFDGTEYVCEGYVPAANAIGVGDIRVTQTNAAQYLITQFYIGYQTGNMALFVRGSGTHTIKIDKLTFIDDGETFTTKTITQNGTYNASSDNADGYSSVTVAIPIVTYHTSSSAPTSSQGSDGDLWLVTA